jgi:hypothetical protein
MSLMRDLGIYWYFHELPEQAQNAKQYGNLRKLNMSENPAAPVAKHGEPISYVSELFQWLFSRSGRAHQTIPEEILKLAAQRDY